MGSSLRRRVNFVGGMVQDNPLAAAATVLTSSGLISLPTVTAAQPDYIPITLDPDGVSGIPEIAWITAHAAAASTATLLRAQEGTAARSCPQDTSWVHGPTTADVGAVEADLVGLRGSTQFLPTTGIGRRLWTSAHLFFDPLTVIGLGHSESIFTSGGFQDIQTPAVGTVIPGFGGIANKTVTSAGIPLSTWESLWYELAGGTGTFNPAQLRAVGFQGGFVPPKHWIFLCRQSGADLRIHWGDGKVTDYWRAVSFLNGWTNYVDQNNFGTVQYRKEADGYVVVRGLMQGGTPPAAAFNLPAGYRPIKSFIFPSSSNNGYSEIRANLNGDIVPQIGSTTWTSVSSVRFLAEA